MAGGIERRRRAWLVVVLHESSQAILEIETGGEMFADRPRMTVAQSVVEPLVVAVVEALLLERPFEIPIDLGHEDESRVSFVNASDRPRPEDGAIEPPGPPEHVGQDEHRHVAAHAVALTGDARKLPDHCLLQRWAGIV